MDPGHFLNPFFLEGMHNLGEGQGSDFYAFYQAGRYVLDGETSTGAPWTTPTASSRTRTSIAIFRSSPTR